MQPAVEARCLLRHHDGSRLNLCTCPDVLGCHMPPSSYCQRQQPAGPK
uniref:Uncharacterized protein n=1 Tax=Arundo donax TaxID=35708 RepID=A0A0A9FMK1_ARUDO